MVQFKIGEHFLIANAPIPSASGFGGGFGYLNTFSQGIWSTTEWSVWASQNIMECFFSLYEHNCPIQKMLCQILENVLLYQPECSSNETR